MRGSPSNQPNRGLGSLNARYELWHELGSDCPRRGESFRMLRLISTKVHNTFPAWVCLVRPLSTVKHHCVGPRRKMHLPINLLLLALAAASPISASASNFTYPAIINDTSLRTSPLLLSVSETRIQAYENKNIQVAFVSNSTDVGTVIDPMSLVGDFILRNRTLQLPTTPPFYASLQPLPDVGDVTRHSFVFSAEQKVGSVVWQMVSVGDDGLYGLQSTAGQYATFNGEWSSEWTLEVVADRLAGFAICNATDSAYEIEYQSSDNGTNAPGCEPIALHVS